MLQGEWQAAFNKFLSYTIAVFYRKLCEKFDVRLIYQSRNDFPLFCSGFSMIDLVENNTTRTKYALKRITCHSVEDQEIALREIELMGRINSDNVIKVIDHTVTGQADIVVNATSEVYIVLPYFKNGSLQDHLNFRARNKDSMPEGQILQLFLGICEGLRAFHEAQPEPLAHRDLKTANICLSNGMEPIIVDLGSAAVARVQIRGQQEAQKLKDLAEERCSIVYRAPELFSVESYCMIDERTDIWVSDQRRKSISSASIVYLC